MRIPYYKQLDGVRAIAALMVMCFHFFGGIASDQPFLRSISRYAVFGQTGVSLFFVLSGFLITRILLTTKEVPKYFENFYARRALRIFPLYYLFLIIYYFIGPLLRIVPNIPWNQQLYYWVYLQNFADTFNWSANGPNHFWSLAVEEHFYLIWPCMVYFLDKRGLKIAIAAILALAIGCRMLFAHRGWPMFYFTFTRLDELAIGALLSIWEAEGKLKDSGRKFLIGFVVVIIPTLVIWQNVTGKAINSIQVIKFNLLSICYFCLVGYTICLTEGGIIYKLLSGKFLSFTGKISYGLYVYHPFCFILINAYFPRLSFLPRLAVSFGVAYLVAAISYFFFEVRFIALKKYFSGSRPATAL